VNNDMRQLTDAELDTVEGGGWWIFGGWWPIASEPSAHYPGGSTPSTNVAKGSV
jgi:hypothetical protein